jgi:hypothetical protein
MEINAVIREGCDLNTANDSSMTVLRASPGSIVVNEIMYRPRAGGSEWIELYNAGENACPLKLWSIRDASSAERVISSNDVSVGRGEYLILAQDPVVFARSWTGCSARVTAVEGGWPKLNDHDGERFADCIEIYDNEGAVVESVRYSDLTSEERGRSIERVSSDLCSSSPEGLWHRCALHSGATPGCENSTSLAHMPANRSLSAFPNPFSIGGDSGTAISGVLRAGESGFRVRIFNLEGEEVGRLFGEEGGARIFTCRWDGRRSDGGFVATGLYVCLAEYVLPGGGVCRAEKICIAVSGGDGAGRRR